MHVGVSKFSDVVWCPAWLAGLRLMCGPGPALKASRLYAVTARRQLFRAQSVVWLLQAASSRALQSPPHYEAAAQGLVCTVQKLDLGEFDTEVEASDKVNEYLRGLNSQPVDPQSPSAGALLPPYILQVRLPAACMSNPIPCRHACLLPA